MNTIDYAELAPEPDDAKQFHPIEKRSFIEQLLSPLMLQRMMACGGAVLVLGFVGWLWSTGVFQEPLVAASAIGLANLAVMAIGIAIVRRSRYHLAGTGITLLAALALPLNLWFYDAQGLITLSDGGHLWIPAALCCAIYAIVARTLRNPLFVYTLVAGVVMTGLLFLADQTVNRFWQLLPPVSFLIAIGWLSFFSERLFAYGPGDFSRKKFGFAFRISGIIVLLGGLALLAGGQLASRFAAIFSIEHLPLIATNQAQKLWAIGLLAGTGAGFTFDWMLSKASRWSLPAAIALFVWAGLAILDLLTVRLQLPHFAILGSIYLVTAWQLKPTTSANADSVVNPLEMASLYAVLSFAGILQYTAQFLVDSKHVLFSDDPFLVTAQMYATAAVGYFAWTKSSDKHHPRMLFLATSAIFSVLAALSFVFAWQPSLDFIAVSTLTFPLAFVVFGLLFAKPHEVAHWQQSALAALWFSLFSTLVISTEIPSTNVHLSLCWMSIVAAIVMAAASYGRKSLIVLKLSYLTASFSISQVLCLWGLPTDYSLVLSAITAGVILSTAAALARNGAAFQSDRLKAWAVQLQEPGNLLVFCGSISGVLLSFNRLLANETTFGLLAVVVFQLAAITSVGLMAQSKAWRMAFRAAGVVNVLAGILVINSSIEAHWLQRAELGTLVFAVALLVIGHLGWYREEDQEDEAATAALWFGSLLTAVPLACGLLFYRSHEVVSIWNWSLFHEATAIIAAMLLLGIGMACKIRSTTIGGGALLTVYVVSLLSLVQWPGQLKSVSVVMMLGGGSFFFIAVLLSIYRDRLLSVPDDIRAGRGMFRVLRWR